MSLSPIGSAVFELLSHKHTDRHHITLEYRLCTNLISMRQINFIIKKWYRKVNCQNRNLYPIQIEHFPGSYCYSPPAFGL